MKKNIVLIGFMGTGKTTIGRMLANRLGRPFIDSDRKIEQTAGMTIPEIFSNYGEQYFRDLESRVIAKICHYTNAVIATGGGAVLRGENMQQMRRNGVVIALTAAPEVILERTCRRGGRPLLEAEDKEQRVRLLLQERREAYNCAHHMIDTGVKSPQAVVDGIITYLRQGGYLRGRS